MATNTSHGHHPLSKAGLLITLGIIFGDIGTSPLYVMKAIVGEGQIIDRLTVLGGVSLVFWTLTLQTTIKYVLLTLRADNKGEGGIFSLYTLVPVSYTHLDVYKRQVVWDALGDGKRSGVVHRFIYKAWREVFKKENFYGVECCVWYRRPVEGKVIVMYRLRINRSSKYYSLSLIHI